MKELMDLFIAFARVGVLTFGGGYAMLPILQREIVEKNNWATERRAYGLLCHRTMHTRSNSCKYSNIYRSEK